MQDGTHDLPDIEWVTIKVPIFTGDIEGEHCADRGQFQRLGLDERQAFHRIYKAFEELFPQAFTMDRSRRPECVRWLFSLVAEAMNKDTPPASKSRAAKK